MRQTSLDSFIPKIPDGHPSMKSKPLLILRDFAVSWYDGDWYLSALDIVNLEPNLTELTVRRGIDVWVDPPKNNGPDIHWTACQALPDKRE